MVTVCDVQNQVRVHFQYDRHFVLFLMSLTGALMCMVASGGSEVHGYVIRCCLCGEYLST